MKKTLLIGLLMSMVCMGKAQIIGEFSADTGLYVSDLRTFTGTYLESSEIPDFERFVRLYDSVSHEQRLDIIEVSNLMLDRKCRPRPHFIAYQRVMIQFFLEEKTSHGYEEWLEGKDQRTPPLEASPSSYPSLPPCWKKISFTPRTPLPGR